MARNANLLVRKGLSGALDTIERSERLDPLVNAARPLARSLGKGPQGAVLSGKWLGHQLHPVLTDLPIGFWTSSFILDVMGGRKARPAAQRLIGSGLLAVVPAALTGLVDWGSIGDRRTQRVGVAHAASNSLAAVLYTLSWNSRRRGRHTTGVLLGAVAAGAATVGGSLGGNLAFGRGRRDS